jgi:DNA-binding CsgD family transcriptional regulator/tetratricopeptide (TPR) repeat protein
MPQALRSGELVARAREVVLLDGLLDEAARGRGRVVLVTGEPGVGKSRLVAEHVERARSAGTPVLVGRAVEGGGAFRPLADALLAHQRQGRLPPADALGPFAPALGRLVPGWAAAGDPDAGLDLPLLVSEGLVRLLRLLGSGSGVVLALDDLHWADADTLTVLDRLAEAVQGLPALLVLAAREGQQPALERLRAAAGVEALPLRRLAAADAAALALSCAGDRALPRAVLQHVVDHADGLPFLVEELLRALVDSGALVPTGSGWEAGPLVRTAVPASFAAVVRQRLSRLDDQARQVVEVAAVVGRAVDWRMLVGLSGLPETAVLEGLRRAVDVGLLRHDDPAEPDLVRFAHALTREAVRERLLAPQRAALARAGAPVLEQAGHLVLAAGLHEEAGDPAQAARLLVRAADAEGAALATREELLRRAADLRPEDDDVALALVEVLVLAGRAAEARDLGEPLLARTGAHDLRRERLALTLARACVVSVQPEQAHRYLAHAGTGPVERALRAQVAVLQGRPDEAGELARAAADDGDPATRCEALEILGRVARLHDRPEEARAHFADALQAAEDHGLPLHRVRALAELGTLDLLGPARHERLEQARTLALASGQLGTAAMLQRQVTACHALRMEHAATLATAESGRELAESLRLTALVGGFRYFEAMAHGHTGRLAEMHAALDEAEQLLQDDVDQLATVPYVRLLPALLEHDLPAVLEGFGEATRRLRASAPSSATPYRGIHALVATVLDDGAPEREDLSASGATVQACNRGALAYADAVAAARAGDDPAPHLSLAEQALEPLTWRRHHFRLLVAPAALRDGWGSPLEWLREAHAWFERSGDAALARACREELRRAGAPVPRRHADAAVPPHLRRAGVTAREYEVLELVAEGLTSSAIAQRLYLSPRTVETHVSRLLAKTGAANRGELRTYVAAGP